jgi:hypothetical protein
MHRIDWSYFEVEMQVESFRIVVDCMDEHGADADRVGGLGSSQERIKQQSSPELCPFARDLPRACPREQRQSGDWRDLWQLAPGRRHAGRCWLAVSDNRRRHHHGGALHRFWRRRLAGSAKQTAAAIHSTKPCRNQTTKGHGPLLALR